MSMAWAGNLSIAKKMALGYGFVLLFTMILAVVSVMQMSKIYSESTEIAANHLPAAAALGNIAFQASAVRQHELASLLDSDAALRERERDDMKDSVESLKQELKAFESLEGSDGQRQLYAQWRADWDKYLKTNNEVLGLEKSEDLKSAAKLALGMGNDQYRAFSEKIAEAVALNDRASQAATQGLSQTYSSARYWIVAPSIAALVLGIIVSVGTSRTI